MKKINFLTNAVILLVLVSLVFSSVAIAVNTKETSKISNNSKVTKNFMQCNPEVDIKKDVWDPDSGWVSANSEETAADLPICETTKFRIKVWNTGDCPVTGGVLDKMDDQLTFISSDPEPDDFIHIPPHYWIIYAFPQVLNPGEAGPEIIIQAHVGGPECTITYNHAVANYTCAHGIIVEDDDYAYVHAHEKSKNINARFLDFIENHINLFPVLRQILGLL